jgi:hypothetical protein
MLRSILRYRFVIGVLLLSMAGCSGGKYDSRKLVTQNDFDQLDGWAPASSALTNERAHSGGFSTKVDNGVDYSLGYATTLGKASPTKLKKLIVSGWVYRTGPQATAVIVVEIKEPATGQGIFWQSMELAKQTETLNNWVEVSQEFALPDNITPTQELRVYMWRSTAQQPVYLDDIKIFRE